MARRRAGQSSRAEGSRATGRGRRVLRVSARALVWGLRGVAALVVLFVLLVAVYSAVNPPTTPFMMSERARLGAVSQTWVALPDVPGHLPRALVAAEDANFCLHWGFDMAAIRLAIAEGSGRGASTISQQTAKNVFLWHGRSFFRKGLEAGATVIMEALWSKRRIIEVYMNVAEFDEGVFGVEAAAQHYFGVPAARLTVRQSAALAAVLPAPKARSARNLTPFLQRRVAAVADGAATIAADGRAGCLQG